MSEKNWYKIETNKKHIISWFLALDSIGSSSLSFEAVAERVEKGQLVRLDDLLYMERGEVKEWASWDKSLQPSVFIQPACIISIMQFKGDPRVVPNK